MGASSKSIHSWGDPNYSQEAAPALSSYSGPLQVLDAESVRAGWNLMSFVPEPSVFPLKDVQ